MGRGNSFLFDADFFHTEKSVALYHRVGFAGEAIYVRLLCTLRSAEDFSIVNDPQVVSYLIGAPNSDLVGKVIEVLNELGLIKIINNRIVSDFIEGDMKRLMQKKEHYRKASIKRERQKHLENQALNPTKILAKSCQNSARILPKFCQNLQVKDKEKDIYNNININNNNNNNNINNINNNKYITKDSIDSLDIPSIWNTEKIREALKTWVEYKTLELKEPYKTLSSLKSLLTTLKKSNPSTELVVYAINYAISRHWKGVALYKDVIEGFNQNTSATNEPISRAEKYRREHPEEFDANGNYIGKIN